MFKNKKKTLIYFYRNVNIEFRSSSSFLLHIFVQCTKPYSFYINIYIGHIDVIVLLKIHFTS